MYIHKNIIIVVYYSSYVIEDSDYCTNVHAGVWCENSLS